MKTTLSALIAAAALVGCAQSMMAGSSSAESQCVNFARNEGLRVVQVDGVDSASGGQNVRLRLEDTLGRRFAATCAVASGGGTRWTQPLPTNAVRG